MSPKNYLSAGQKAKCKQYLSTGHVCSYSDVIVITIARILSVSWKLTLKC